MRLSKSSFVIFAGLFLLLGGKAFASVDFTIYPNAGLLGPAMYFTTDAENLVVAHPQSFINNNEKVISYGIALSNTFGYPNGKGIIPNFEAGFAAGAAVYQYDRYENFSKDDPTVPGAGANAAVHFGFGLSDVTDITFKMFINQNMYSPEKNIKKESGERLYDFTLNETDLISLGVKGRYNIISETEIIPYIFSFGGVTAGVAVDFSHGKISSTGRFKDTTVLPLEGTDSFSGDPFTQYVSIQTTVDGTAAYEWNVISVTPEIMTYADFFYFLTLYTGPAVSLNAGSANLTMTAEGVMKNLDPVYSDDGHILLLAGPNNNIATGKLNINAPFNVPLAIPLWKVGCEINISAFKIQAEGAVVLTSPLNSFTMQLGMRVQF